MDGSKKREHILSLTATVCQVRESQALAGVAQVTAALKQLDEQLEHEAAGLRAVQDEMHQAAATHGVSAAMLNLLEGHRACVQTQMRALGEQKQRQTQQLGVAHQALHEAKKETMRMERALERTKDARRAKRAKRERQEQEEQSVLRHRRDHMP